MGFLDDVLGKVKEAAAGNSKSPEWPPLFPAIARTGTIRRAE
jgi:hypothetical protein